MNSSFLVPAMFSSWHYSSYSVFFGWIWFPVGNKNMHYLNMYFNCLVYNVFLVFILFNNTSYLVFHGLGWYFCLFGNSDNLILFAFDFVYFCSFSISPFSVPTMLFSWRLNGSIWVLPASQMYTFRSIRHPLRKWQSYLLRKVMFLFPVVCCFFANIKYDKFQTEIFYSQYSYTHHLDLTINISLYLLH